MEVNRAELAIAMVHDLRAVLPHLEEDRSGEVVVQLYIPGILSGLLKGEVTFIRFVRIMR